MVRQRDWLTFSHLGPFASRGLRSAITGALSVAGVVRLPLRLDWSERAEFHLDDPAVRNVTYERVIREASQVDDLRS
jgi:hypothetical protein